MVSPQPTTLAGWVDKAREFDHQFRANITPRQSTGQSSGRCTTRVQELTEERVPTTEINAQGPRKSFKRKKLTPEIRAYRLKHNLCLYCGGPGHVAAVCKAAPNKRPNAPTPLRNIETIPEEDENPGTTSETGMNQISTNSFAVLESLDSMDVDKSLSF